MTKHKEKKTNKPGLFKEKFTKMANMQKNEKIKAHLTAFSLNYQINHLRTNWIITDLVGYLVLFFFLYLKDWVMFLSIFTICKVFVYICFIKCKKFQLIPLFSSFVKNPSCSNELKSFLMCLLITTLQSIWSFVLLFWQNLI